MSTVFGCFVSLLIQWHLCDLQILDPSRKATAIRRDCLLSLSDIDGNGMQFSQSEACSEETALNLALSLSVLADCSRFSNLFLHKGISQAA